MRGDPPFPRANAVWAVCARRTVRGTLGGPRVFPLRSPQQNPINAEDTSRGFPSPRAGFAFWRTSGQSEIWNGKVKPRDRMARHCDEVRQCRSGSTQAPSPVRKPRLFFESNDDQIETLGSHKESPARAGLSLPKGMGLSRHRHHTCPNLHTRVS